MDQYGKVFEDGMRQVVDSDRWVRVAGWVRMGWCMKMAEFGGWARLTGWMRM